MTPMLLPQFIPSPPTGVWMVFGFPIRAYALCIIAGIVVAMIIANRRWRARGGNPESLEMAVVVGIPFGIVGARLYHVITDWQLYFGPGRDPIDALKIWNGGLGVWGAVALGALGGYLVARRRNIRFPALLDAVAPGIAVAQAIGRLGNWFNQELFGAPTTLPWGLEIAVEYRPAGFEQFATFHPTFLYELLWNLGVAAVLIWADRRFRLGHGKVFALYVVLYTAGRFWIEALRIDTVNEIGGFRLNNYTSLIVFVAALIWLLWLIRYRPGREAVVEGDEPPPQQTSRPEPVEGPTSSRPEPVEGPTSSRPEPVEGPTSSRPEPVEGPLADDPEGASTSSAHEVDGGSTSSAHEVDGGSTSSAHEVDGGSTSSAHEVDEGDAKRDPAKP